MRVFGFHDWPSMTIIDIHPNVFIFWRPGYRCYFCEGALRMERGDDGRYVAFAWGEVSVDDFPAAEAWAERVYLEDSSRKR